MAVPQRNYSYPEIQQVPKVRKKRKTLNVRILSKLVVAGIFTYMIFSFGFTFYEGYKLKQEINKLQGQLGTLQEENTRLQQELEYVQTPEAIEKMAREKLGLIKPGETVIMKARGAL
ncbi:MAG: FtsB family cell division protein [Bacillota bacterium]